MARVTIDASKMKFDPGSEASAVWPLAFVALYAQLVMAKMVEPGELAQVLRETRLPGDSHGELRSAIADIARQFEHADRLSTGEAQPGGGKPDLTIV